MDIINVSLNHKLDIQEESIACIGYFDGVHLGHQSLINKTIELAKDEYIPACITFDIDPWIIVKRMGDHKLTHLTSNEDKFKLLEKFGIKRCYLLQFTQEMADLEPIDFINLLKSLNIKTIICGDDFRFAKKGAGNPQVLNNYINTYVCEELEYSDLKISSSLIERSLKFGDIEGVGLCLGRLYCIKGKVIKGNQIGQKIGFPTANLKLDYNYVIPRTGVYAGKVLVKNKTYDAMINIGTNPTINPQDKISIEAHIIDFNQNIYDEDMVIYFNAYLRDERDFIDSKHLVKQLQMDKKAVIDYKGVW